VRGEWFHLVGDEVQTAVGKCRDLAEKFNRYSKVKIIADHFAQLVSSAEVVSVSDDAIAWAKEYEKSQYVITSSQTVQERLSSLIIDALQKGFDVSSIGRMQTKRSSTFNLDGFRKNCPDLYNLFYKRSEMKVVGKFRLIPQIQLVKDFHDDSSLVDFHNTLTDALNALDRYEAGEIKITELKNPYLDLKASKRQAQADKEIAMDNLKSLCGQAGGIKGICHWIRTEISKFRLDRDALRKTHPEIFKEFTERHSTPVFVVGAIPNWDSAKFLKDFD